MKSNTAKFIEEMGGAAQLARILKLPAESGTQTVHNWKTRGIPAHILVAHPKVFRKFLKSKAA